MLWNKTLWIGKLVFQWEKGMVEVRKHHEINSLVSEHIFPLHYAPEKVLIYSLQYINHPSNFQMRNASLTFMLFSISLLYGKEGNKDRFLH